MDDPVSHGLPFDIGDLWRPPTFGRPEEDGSIFSPIDTVLPPLEPLKDQPQPHFDLRIDLALPDVEDAAGLQLDILDGSPKSPAVAAKANGDLDLDIWDLDLKQHVSVPKLYTWEAFEKTVVQNSDRTSFLSEAGPDGFDAAIATLTPRNDVGVLPRDYVLRAMSNLVLARSSSLFQWNEAESQFEPTIQGASMSGISTTCSDSVSKTFTEFGSSLTKLHRFSQSTKTSRHKNSARMALQSCISSILDAVDEVVSRALRKVRSVLQLQHLVQHPQMLVSALLEITASATQSASDSSLISAVSDAVHRQAVLQPRLHQILKALLDRTCSPWLEKLAARIGFPGPEATLTASDCLYDSDLESTDPLPEFVTNEDAALLKETCTAVKLLRSLSPNHALFSGVDVHPSECFTDARLSRAEVAEVATEYEVRFLGLSKKATKSRKDSATDPIAPTLEESSWTDVPGQASYLAKLSTLMSDEPQLCPSSESDFRQAVMQVCHPEDADPSSGSPAELVQAVTLAPLERLQPLLKTQRRLVNAALLRQLFRQHKLCEHLELQRLYHLFGNGNFVARLSIALFSQEVQSAERRRGAMPTSETMGLRLGGSHEERWPPASSELQLTLMGILSETYRSHSAQKIGNNESGGLLGSLSFSIRQLPEEDIDRVLDPNSIYALDFLRLQYTPPAPIDAIMTTVALEKYDDMFRLLLKLLRLIHVTSTTSRLAFAESSSIARASALTFASAAHHFMSIFLSHIMDIGIDTPWHMFMEDVTRLETDLVDEDSRGEMGTRALLGISGLSQLHDECLERIRSRLFLKRKQEKFRSALENVLAAILKTSFALQASNEEAAASFKDGARAFQQAVRGFCALLQVQVDKPPKTVSSSDAEEIEVSRLLLSRLNWNEFYQDAG